ncbi:MAG TPA: putative sugar O-methyltransferase, partial [bacterium]|nr:putative sugar O-methyltransferase [bacterium]
MFSDMQKADIQWKPSDYWLKKYCHPGAAILKKYGFDNFRDYNYPSLGMVYTFTKGLNINAGSLKWYIFELVKKIPGFSHLFQLYENNIAYLKRTMSKQHAELLRLLYFSAVQMDPADSLLKISDSMAGNPTEPLVIENRNYTYDFLRFFLRYCYAARYVDFRKIDCIMEIGSGYGGQAEIVAKIH